jgi:hypothetical protein
MTALSPLLSEAELRYAFPSPKDATGRAVTTKVNRVKLRLSVRYRTFSEEATVIF